jgi:hypothetical protein
MFISSLLISYIDPVSGVILLQLVIGGCIAGFAFLYGKIGGGLRLLNPFSKAKQRTDLQRELKLPPLEK